MLPSPVRCRQTIKMKKYFWNSNFCQMSFLRHIFTIKDGSSGWVFALLLRWQHFITLANTLEKCLSRKRVKLSGFLVSRSGKIVRFLINQLRCTLLMSPPNYDSISELDSTTKLGRRSNKLYLWLTWLPPFPAVIHRRRSPEELFHPLLTFRSHLHLNMHCPNCKQSKVYYLLCMR
jgi:hypothetical protein